MNQFFRFVAAKSSSNSRSLGKELPAFVRGLRRGSRLAPATVAVASLFSAGLAPAAGTLYWDYTV